MKITIDNLIENKMEVFDYPNKEIKRVTFEDNIENFKFEFNNEWEVEDFIDNLVKQYGINYCNCHPENEDF